MNLITKQIALIERIDQLVRMEATGSYVELANRLHISQAKLYRIIDIMKELNAPIVYNFTRKSFIYEEEVGFKFGFYHSNLNTDDIRAINGGMLFSNKRSILMQFIKR